MRRTTVHIIFCLLLFPLWSCSRKSTDKPKEPLKNIILISIDTLRADALSIYGSRVKTPFFESFARNAVVFDHAFTCAPITLPAHTSLLTGLYPPHHGVRNNGTFRAQPKLHLLSEYAKQNGFATAAVVGGFPLAAPFGLNQGFDRYDDRFAKSAEVPGSFILAERNAESVVAAAEDWLGSVPQDQRIFLWMHFFDPHHPYLSHGESGISEYEQEVRYVDKQLQRFFDFLKKAQRDRNTIFIITSDHGEAFGEHGEISHSLFVYNTTLRIPLLVSYPGVKPHRENSLVSIVDIAPTILDLNGWKTEAAGAKLDGVSLIGTNRASIYAETFAPALDFGWSPLLAIQDLRTKYIQAPHPEFYRLDQDPGEINNIVASADVSRLRSKIAAITAGSAAEDAKYTPTVEQRERLQSLGYFSSPAGKTRPDVPDPKDRIDVARKIAELTMSPSGLRQKSAEYERLVREDPQNPLLLLRYAEILLQQKEYGKAGAFFQRVLDLEYFSAAAYNGMATVFFYRNQPARAEKMLSTAVALNAADGETYYNLGEFAFQRADREKAVADYRRSMGFGFLPAYYRLARLQEIVGDYKGALRILAEAEQRAANDPELNNERGMTYFRHHDFSAALDEFQKGYAKDPNQYPFLYSIGITYYRMNELEKARSYLTEFLKRAPAEMEDQRRSAMDILRER